MKWFTETTRGYNHTERRATVAVRFAQANFSRGPVVGTPEPQPVHL
jgi:hypothetical protein